MKAKNIIGFIIAVILIILILNPGLLPLAPETVNKILELRKEHFLIEKSLHITNAHILTLMLALCIVQVVYTIIKTLLNFGAKENEHSATIATLLTGLFKYLAVIIAFIWGLSILGVNTTAVLAGAGIIGLIIGFGAQSLIEDIITGLFIIFERQYEIGDIIILDDFRGTVKSIGARTTVIEDTGGNLKVVNNSDIRNFQNRSRNDSYALCDISVAYNTDVARMEKIIGQALPEMYSAHKDLYLSVPEYLGVEALADSGVNLKLRVKTKEETVFKARRTLNRDMLVLFNSTDIEIPFPQVVVHNGDKEE